MDLRTRLREGLFLMDGAMGTQIQAAHVAPEAWLDRPGCNEILNLSLPDLIADIHRRYLEAGCDAVETNSFGGSPLTLAEYGLEDKAAEINQAAARIAREAADEMASAEHPRFVFGSVGPGARLASLGQVSFGQLRDAYRVQIEALLEGGCDGIIVETCQDPLQIKAAIAAFREVTAGDRSPLLYVSFTIETSGTMLVGTDAATLLAVVEPLGVDILGINCGTGPEPMRIHLDTLAAGWPGFLGVMPNAGIPVLRSGVVTYPLQPDRFAAETAALVKNCGLNVAGGCCGTTPEHLRRLRRELEDYTPPRREVTPPERVASLYTPVDLTQDPPPLYVGERANATGSRRFREALLRDDYDTAMAILIEQEERGAHVLDLSCAYAGRDEKKDLEILAARAVRECRLPLMFDSTDPVALEAALQCYGGRPIINSVNLEAGEQRAARIVELAARYGAALVCLLIDEKGMAMSVSRKLEIARRLVDFCLAHGLRPSDLLVDCLTFTVASGDPSLRGAALETLEALERVKQEIASVRTILGISNVSFGLKAEARRVLNSVFLHHCLERGLDACIVNVGALQPYPEIPDRLRQAAEKLLFNRGRDDEALEEFIGLFEKVPATTPAGPGTASLPPDEQLAQAVVRGRTDGIGELIRTLLQEHAAVDILNQMLIPAMEEVGRLFDQGLLQLPFVLKSAEVMKKAVEELRPHLPREQSDRPRATLVLATVAGDVHDIGKNLVDIILSNNGFRVINLGIKVPVEQMIEAVRKHRAEALGMSGLLVKSAAVMAENMYALESSGLNVPVLLGGAALTPEFVENDCRPRYSAAVFYCRDAFDGLKRMKEIAAGLTAAARTTAPKESAPRRAHRISPGKVRRPPVVDPPEVPFFGCCHLTGIPAEEIYRFLDDETVIRARWALRRGRQPPEEWRKRIEQEAIPRLQRLKEEYARPGRLRARAAYGYFPCRAEGDELLILLSGEDQPLRLRFPRQQHPPFRAIPDFFREDRDVVAMMVVTVGQEMVDDCARLREADAYQDYFLLHGFAVELTDALAEFVHWHIRREMGIGEPPRTPREYAAQKYRGSRYAFGYSACPDLSMNRVCCRLLEAERIGISLTEHYMLVPEYSTSALVAHHPQARYFNVEKSNER